MGVILQSLLSRFAQSKPENFQVVGTLAENVKIRINLYDQIFNSASR